MRYMGTLASLLISSCFNIIIFCYRFENSKVCFDHAVSGLFEDVSPLNVTKHCSCHDNSGHYCDKVLDLGLGIICMETISIENQFK